MESMFLTLPACSGFSVGCKLRVLVPADPLGDDLGGLRSGPRWLELAVVALAGVGMAELLLTALCEFGLP